MSQNDLSVNERIEMKKEGKTPRKKSGVEKAKKVSFTVLDLLVFVVIVLCVLGIGFRNTIAELFVSAEPSQNVEIGFKTVAIEKGGGEQLTVGATLLLPDDETLGVVSSIVRETAKTAVSSVDGNGSLVWTEVDDSQHDILRGTVTVNARYGDSGLKTVDGYDLYVGKIINIHTASYTVTVTITEIPRK